MQNKTSKEKQLYTVCSNPSLPALFPLPTWMEWHNLFTCCFGKGERLLALLARFGFLVLCWPLCAYLCYRAHLSGTLAGSLPISVNNPSCGWGSVGEFPQCMVFLNAEDWWHISTVERRGRPKHGLSFLPLLLSEQQRARGRKTCSLKDPIPNLP